VQRTPTRREGEYEDRLEAIIAGATQSLAAQTEAMQGRLPFWVQSTAWQTYGPTTSGVTSSLVIPPLASQLVRVTGLLVAAVGTTAGQLKSATLQLGNALTIPIPVAVTTNTSSAQLALGVCSIMLDTLSQGAVAGGGGPNPNLALNVVAGDVHNMTLAAWLWGEQVPTTGMVN
jgi:hypothetical protein